MIESPEYPRGLWLHLADEAGQALAGIQVNYHGLPNGLVALHCVDPAGLRREMLLWTLPQGDPLRLTLQRTCRPAGGARPHRLVDRSGC